MHHAGHPDGCRSNERPLSALLRKHAPAIATQPESAAVTSAAWRGSSARWLPMARDRRPIALRQLGLQALLFVELGHFLLPQDRDQK